MDEYKSLRYTPPQTTFVSLHCAALTSHACGSPHLLGFRPPTTLFAVRPSLRGVDGGFWNGDVTHGGCPSFHLPCFLDVGRSSRYSRVFSLLSLSRRMQNGVVLCLLGPLRGNSESPSHLLRALIAQAHCTCIFHRLCCLLSAVIESC